MDKYERRRVDIGCLQEIWYGGQGTRVCGGEEKYTFWWSGSEEGRIKEGIMVKEVQEGKVEKLRNWMIE